MKVSNIPQGMRFNAEYPIRDDRTQEGTDGEKRLVSGAPNRLSVRNTIYDGQSSGHIGYPTGRSA
jgi:hypothetical protein